MTTTPFLGLSTNDIDSGSSVYFLDWRLAMNGVVSNMSIIDKFAEDTSGSISVIRSNMGAYPVNAYLVTPSYYEASNTAIDSYSIGMIIDLVLDVTNGLNPELNINFFGTKPLYKIDASGSAITISNGDLRENHHNLFSYQTTHWIWVASATSIDQLTFSGSAGNLLSIGSGSTIVDSGISASSVLTGASGSTGNLLMIGSGSTIADSGILASSVIFGIAGSGIMSDTTGSVIKHNNSGIVSGSYNQVYVDAYGHVTSGSISGSSSSGIASIAGSGIMSDTTGSIVKHNLSGVSSGSYNQFITDVYGHIISASFIESGSDIIYEGISPINIAGSLISHVQSGVVSGSYSLISITVDDTGHITNIESGSSLLGGEIFWNVDGALATGSGIDHFIVTRDITIGNAYIYCENTGTSGCTIIDISKNGTTVFTNEDNRPMLAFDDSDKIAKSGVPDIIDFVENDIISFDIDQVANGSAELTVTLITSSVGQGGSGSGITSIAGSSVMSDTNGSVVKHNSSGIIAGTYNILELDEWGHAISGSYTSGSMSGFWNPLLPPDDSGSSTAYNDEFRLSSGSWIDDKWSIFDPESVLQINKLDNGLNLSTTGSAICGIMQSVPAGDFCVWTKVSPVGSTSQASGYGVFLGYDLTSNPTTGSILTASCRIDGYAAMCANSEYFTYYADPYPVDNFNQFVDWTSSGMYVRVRHSSGNVFIDYSIDGISWTNKVFSFPFTPTEVGLFAKDVYDGAGIFPFFRATDSADISQIMRGSDLSLGSGNSLMSGSGIMSDTTGSIIKHNESGVTTGSYNQFEVDKYGHVVSASCVSGKFWNSMLPPSTPNALDDEFDDQSLDVKWDVFDPDTTLTVSELANGLNMNNSGSTICGILQDVPVSGSFTLWTKVNPLGWANAISMGWGTIEFGIVLCEDITSVSSGSILAASFGVMDDRYMTCQVIERIGYDDPTQYGDTSLIYFSEGDTLPPPGMFIRMIYNSGSVIVEYSGDGVFWYRGGSLSPIVLDFTPAKVGLFATNSTNSRGIFSFFRVTDDTDIFQVMRGNR